MSFIADLKSFLQRGIVVINTPDKQCPILRTVLSIDGDANCFVDAGHLTPDLMARHIKRVLQQQQRLHGVTDALRLLLHYLSHFTAGCSAIYAVYTTIAGHGWQHVVMSLMMATLGSIALHQILKVLAKRVFKGIF